MLSIHSGQPFSVLSPNDNSGTGEGYQRAVEVSNPYANVPSGFWINPTSFVEGPTGEFQGTSGRNQVFGPGYESVDLSVFKTGTIHEFIKIEFRAELFNILNHVNYAPPLNVADGSSLGQLYDTIGDYNGAPGIGPGEPFNTQLGLKVRF